MLTYLVERIIPPRFDPAYPDQVAPQARWATDARRFVDTRGSALKSGTASSLRKTP